MDVLSKDVALLTILFAIDIFTNSYSLTCIVAGILCMLPACREHQVTVVSFVLFYLFLWHMSAIFATLGESAPRDDPLVGSAASSPATGLIHE